ncbi:MAG: TetR/AcrR family transcriptional regulator, partial [Ruminococcus sp.]|nr:TetR/AcrR family transcriptional regulator [Ruminococcus sp.]
MTDEKKQKYADVFRQLLKTKEYDQVTINEICEKCGTYRPNFYYHFKSKDDLAEWIFLQDLKVIERKRPDLLESQTELLEKMKENNVFYLKSLAKKYESPLFTYMKDLLVGKTCEHIDIEFDSMDEISRFTLEYKISAWIMTVLEWLSGMVDI